MGEMERTTATPMKLATPRQRALEMKRMTRRMTNRMELQRKTVRRRREQEKMPETPRKMATQRERALATKKMMKRMDKKRGKKQRRTNRMLRRKTVGYRMQRALETKRMTR